MEMPSQEEQMIAEQYVLQRPIVRPDTDVKKVMRYVSAYFAASFLAALLSFHLFDWLGIFHMLPNFFCNLSEKHPIIFENLLYLSVFILVFLFFLNTTLQRMSGGDVCSSQLALNMQYQLFKNMESLLDYLRRIFDFLRNAVAISTALTIPNFENT